MRCVSCRRSPAAVLLAIVAASVPAAAHNYVGLELRDLVRARVQSPSASATDLPVPLPGTDLSVVCFGVRNTGLFDSRITAIGLDLPGGLRGFTLVSPVSSGFHLIENVEHVPGLNDVTLDFALVSGRTFGGGKPAAGLPPSGDLTTFCVSGPFPQTMPIERMLDLGVLRVQRAGPDGEMGDLAVWADRP